jgi:hypothetical protein
MSRDRKRREIGERQDCLREGGEGRVVRNVGEARLPS